jgi:hypothetical protein
MFAGSVYFAVYFWDRFGLLGPLVAGGLLAIYGLSFAGVGYLLQRRYRAELSARVLYAVATAILPVASTLLGEPIRTEGTGVAILASGIVVVFGAATYPAILVAASLFQREIGKPFARAFVALLWAIGLAPLVAVAGIHGVAVAYVYLAAVAVLAMYWRVREVGRVFERATVIYVVGGSAYLIWLASAGGGDLSTIQHAILAETLGVLYTLGARRTGHRALGLVAIAFYNAGLMLLWVTTDRRDPLYYVVPLGISISLLARIYRSHMSRAARRGLRATGSLVIYFATYHQVVQFDHGLYPLLLGGFTLAGIALGFWLQLRELFLLSTGFLVLDVISNLAYYGVHRPVLGWTLLTVAGLCLTVSGIVFQLRRTQVRGFVAEVRATMADWD